MFKVICTQSFGALPLFKAEEKYDAEEIDGGKTIKVYPHPNHLYGYEFPLEKFVEHFKRKTF